MISSKDRPQMAFVVDLVEIVLRFSDLEKQRDEFSERVSTSQGKKAAAEKNLDYYEGTLKHNGATMSVGEKGDYEGRKAATLTECNAVAQSLHADETSLSSVESELMSLDNRKNAVLLNAYGFLDLENVEGFKTLSQAKVMAKSKTAEDKNQIRKTLATDDDNKLVLRPKTTFASLADVLMQIAFDIAEFTTATSNVKLFVHDKLSDYEIPLMFTSWEQRFNQCVFQSREKVAALHSSLVSIVNHCPAQSFAKILSTDPVRWSKFVSLVDYAFKHLVLVDNIKRALALYSRVFAGKHPRELFTVNFKLTPQCRTAVVPPVAQLTTSLVSMMQKTLFTICPPSAIADLSNIQMSTTKVADPYLSFCQSNASIAALLANVEKDIVSCADAITEATCKIEKAFGHLWSPEMTLKSPEELNEATIRFELEHYPRTSVRDAIMLNSFPLQDATLSMIRIQLDNAKEKEFPRRVERISGDSSACSITFEGMRKCHLPDDAAVISATRYTYSSDLIVNDPVKYALKVLSGLEGEHPSSVAAAATPTRTASTTVAAPAVLKTPPQPSDRSVLSPRNTKYETVYVPPPPAAPEVTAPSKAPPPPVRTVDTTPQARVSSAKPRSIEPLQPSALELLRSSNGSSALPTADSRLDRNSPPKMSPLVTTPQAPTPSVSATTTTGRTEEVDKNEAELGSARRQPPLANSPLKPVAVATPLRVSDPYPSLPSVVDSGRGGKLPQLHAASQGASPNTKPEPLGLRNSPPKAQSSPRESTTAYSLGRLNSIGNKQSAYAPPGRIGSASGRPPSQGNPPVGTPSRAPPARVFQNPPPVVDSGRLAKNAWATPPRASNPTTVVEQVADASAYKSTLRSSAYPTPNLKGNQLYTETPSREPPTDDSTPNMTSLQSKTQQVPSTAPTGSSRTKPVKESAVDDDEALLASLMKKEKESLERIQQMKNRRSNNGVAPPSTPLPQPQPQNPESDRVKALEVKLAEETRRREDRKNLERAETDRLRKSHEAEKMKEMEQRFERRNTPPPIGRTNEPQPPLPVAQAEAPRPDSALRRKLSLPTQPQTAAPDPFQGSKLPTHPTPPSVPQPLNHPSGRKPSTAPVASLPNNAELPLISPRELSKLSLLEAYKQFCSRLGMKPNSGILKLLPTTPGEFVSSINLDLNYIGVRGFKPLLEVLRINRGLKFLNLKDNNLENSEVKALVGVLMGDSGDQLTHIDLSNNPISLAGGSSLMDLVSRQKSLTTVVLKGTLIQQKVVEKILEAASRNAN